MTAYNSEKYISSAIESVLASEYSNFELIIVDDCSIDKTYEICQSFLKQDTRIRLFRNDFNVGDYTNRNKAAQFARGAFLKYLDSDDIMYPHCLQVMVNAMVKYPEAGFAFCNKSIQCDAPFPYEVKSEQAFLNHYTRKGFFYAGPGGAIIRAKAFNQCGGFSSVRHISDTDLWMKLAKQYSVVVMSPALIWWRRHDNQESIIEQKNDSVIAERLLLEKRYLLSPDLPLDEHRRNSLLFLLNRKICFKVVSLLIQRRFAASALVQRKLKINWAHIILTCLKYGYGYRKN